MNYTIKQIKAEETYAIRHPVLREGKPIDSCKFNGDDLLTTFHLGLFTDEKLVGVGSFLQNKNNLLVDDNQFQLRGMAILKPFQRKKFGQILLEYAESELKKQQITLLWCHARETATNFYKKCGYQIIGNPFNIESAGIQYIMYKNL